MTNPAQLHAAHEADRGNACGFHAADAGREDAELSPAMPGALARALRPGYRGEGRGDGARAMEREAEPAQVARVRFVIMGEPGLISRFEALVSPEPMSGCWLWTGAPGDGKPNGQYGRFRVRGRQLKAHRVAWLLFRGDIPDGQQVLHQCDNPVCVRPDHLFLGTNADNVADRVRKGRSGNEPHPGESHPMAKLTAEMVRVIRGLRKDGLGVHRLAQRFNVTPGHISEIINRKRWASVE